MSERDEGEFGSLAGQVAVVTGSSSGIGRAIAWELADAGADVIIHARRSREAAEETAAGVRSRGRNSIVLLCDIGKSDEHEQFVEQCFSWQGRVDAWLNNAGADLLTGEAKTWNYERKLLTLLAVDVSGTVLLSKLVGERMQAAGSGVILTTGWDQAAGGMAGDSGELFATSKGAIMAFTRSLALSLGPQVRVNCIAPGWIRTAWGNEASDFWQNRARREAARDRWGLPDDVARMARFLCSPAADFITGQVINVNGGFRPTAHEAS